MDFNISNSDILDIVSLVVNITLGIWIVKVLQNNLANKRYLKDHIITEIKEIRFEYKKFLSDLHKGNLEPQNIVPWFKLMNIKINDMMDIISSEYKVDKDWLKSYQVDLRELVTEFKEFTENYNDNSNLRLSTISRGNLIKFQQRNYSKFNSLIIEINGK